MPAFTLFGQISAISLLVAIPAALHTQTATAASQSSDSSMVGAAPANASVDVSAQAPASARIEEQEGDLLMVHQRYQAALAAYSKVEQSSTSLWNKMGIAHQMMFDPKGAIHCYKEALKIDPGNAHALNNLATLDDARRDFIAAERLYRQALKINPGSARTLRNLGTNLTMQHRYSESAEAYAQALALDSHILDQNSGPTAEDRVSIKDRGEESYLSARTCARAGLSDCAIAQLRKAFDEGSVTKKQVDNDKDFIALRGTPEFERLLAGQE